MSTMYVDNLRENTLNNGVHIPGHVVQVKKWDISPVTISTGGSWAAATVPTIANTYSVADYNFTKIYSNSKVMSWAMGNADPFSSATGHPTIVCLFETGGTYMGGAYRHVRVANDEPLAFNFAGEDTTTGINKTYKLRCHSSNDGIRFGRSANNNSAHTYNVILMEIAQ